jgi:DNA polymerase-1
MFPEYKAGRKKDQEFNPAPDVRRLVSLIKCTELQPNAAEADDAIAGFIRRKPDALHLILSSDKDLWTLRGPNVQIVSFQEILGDDDILKSCTKHYGGMPKSITLAKALFGDKSDGLPGVPRLLKKHVASLLETVETPDELLASLDGIPAKTADKIREHEAHIKKMYQVVQLRPEVRIKKREREGNEASLREFINEFECSSLQSMIKFMCT